MSLETATWVSEFSSSNPQATDLQAQGDDHLRLIKSVLQSTFPNASRAFRFPSAVLLQTANYTVGVTEANVLLPMNATGGNKTVTLPSGDSGVTLKDGFTFYMIKTDSSDNLVTVGAAQNINAAVTYVIRNQYKLNKFTYSLLDNQWYTDVFALPFLASNPKTDNYTLLASDNGKLLPFTIAAAKTLTLPSTLPAGFRCTVVKANSSAFQLTLSAAATVNGAASQAVSRQYVLINLWWDGTLWWSDYVANLTAVTPPGGRLSLSSGTPVTTTDLTAQATVYYYPWKGGVIPIYDSTLAAFASVAHTAELSLTLVSAHTTASIFDVFAFVDPTDLVTLRIGTGPAWTSAKVRGTGASTTELTMQNGIQVNANAITLRNSSTTYSIAVRAATYLGSFYTTAAGQTEDSLSKRVLSNAYNIVRRSLKVVDPTNTWSGAGSTYRLANAAATNKVDVLQGILGYDAHFKVIMMGAHSANQAQVGPGVGLDSTTANSAQIYGGFIGTGGGSATAEYCGNLGLGLTAVNWLEHDSNPGGTLTYYGDNGSTIVQTGMVGEVYN